MLTSNAQLEWDEAALRIANDEVFSRWLRLMLDRTLERPGVVAARDALVLAAILRGRRNELATGHPLIEPRRDGARSRPGPAVGGASLGLRRESEAVGSAAAAVQAARRAIREDPRPKLVVFYLDHAGRSVAHSIVEPRPAGFDGRIAPMLLDVAERVAAAEVVVTHVTTAARVHAIAEAHDLIKALRESGRARGVELRDYVRFAPHGLYHSLEEHGSC